MKLGRCDWLIDSGTARHLANDQAMFTTFKKYSQPVEMIGCGTGFYAIGEGTVILHARTSTGPIEARLTNTLLVPQMAVNLLSVGQAIKGGFTQKINQYGEWEFVNGQGTTVLNGYLWGTLFKLDVATTPTFIKSWSTFENDEYTASPISFYNRNTSKIELLRTWHFRLGHLGQPALQNHLYHLGIKFREDDYFCDSCARGKVAHTNQYSEPIRKTRPLEKVYIDLCGPIGVKETRENYYLIIVDDFTRYTWIHMLRTKEGMEVSAALKHWIASMFTRHLLKVQEFALDNGTEFKPFLSDIIRPIGIGHSITVPYHSEVNGVAERKHRVIWDTIRCMKIDGKLKNGLWPELARTAVYLINRRPSRALQRNLTPFEALYGEPPDISYLRRVGSRAYKLVPKKKFPKKYDDRSHLRVLVGFEGVNVFRLWDPITGAIERAREVLFDESTRLDIDGVPDFKLPNSSANDPGRQAPELILPGGDSTDPIWAHDEQIAIAQEWEKRMSRLADHDHVEDLSGPNLPTAMARSRLIHNSQPMPYCHLVSEDLIEASPDSLIPLDQFDQWIESTEFVYANESADPMNPSSFKAAMDSPYADQWKAAIQSELDSLHVNNTWDVIEEREATSAPLTGKWVFTVKRNAQGEIDRFKARYVLRGFEQTEGINYHETFAAVVKPMSYRILFVIAVHHNWFIHQMDVVTAFLYGDIDCEVYMELPEGSRQPGMVCKLNKAIYGLKQAPRIWYQTITKCLGTLLLITSDLDGALYKTEDEELFIGIYVDDLLIVGKDEGRINELKAALALEFKMKDLGICQYFLGIAVKYTDTGVQLHQTTYTNQILAKFKMSEANPVTVPMDPNAILVPAADDYQCEHAKKRRYQSIVGHLMYLMCCTRPDIAYSVSTLSRFCHNPSPIHIAAAKRVLRYLRGSTDYGLDYQRGDIDLQGFTDAEFGSDKHDSKSIGGYVFKLGGMAVSWKSKKQPTVATSTCDSEYTALYFGVREAIWLRNLLGWMGLPHGKEPVRIMVDSQSAIRVANNPELHERTKHFRIKYHFTRECINEGLIQTDNIASRDETADILTKPLSKDLFLRHREGMGVRRIQGELLKEKADQSRSGT